MESIQQRLSAIKVNIERLVRNLQAARQENKLLKTQLETLRMQVTEKTKAMEQMKEELDLLKTAHAIKTTTMEQGELSEEQKAVRKKINEYIREIDACIKKLEHQVI
ncbi:MAG: hypothetical protein ABR95_08460 [Sphingobacteriales bacterium BACL12 MAG-120813-bin55]|jgi:chromosome segregation ATPase|nr:MAG: hypothetical protein ABR95_08460 [Sphingobacteriales bacterium BACL12 MAG-120813-bin55]